MMISDTSNKTFSKIPLQQSWTDLYFLETVLTDFKPKLIVELGTGYGGLTRFFTLHAPTYSFDISHDRLKFKSKDCTYILADVLGDRFIENMIADIIKNVDGRVFLFIDNGNKPKEVQIYTKYLRGGDIFFTHDFGTEIMQIDLDPYIKGFAEIQQFDLTFTMLKGYVKQ